jgi:hypothetical protein
MGYSDMEEGVLGERLLSFVDGSPAPNWEVLSDSGSGENIKHHTAP